MVSPLHPWLRLAPLMDPRWLPAASRAVEFLIDVQQRRASSVGHKEVSPPETRSKHLALLILVIHLSLANPCGWRMGGADLLKPAKTHPGPTVSFSKAQRLRRTGERTQVNIHQGLVSMIM